MEIICDEESCSLGHGACFACFLIVSVFIIQIYAFNNSLMGHIKGKGVRYISANKKLCAGNIELFEQMLHQFF